MILLAGEREEGRNEGRIEGRLEGRLEGKMEGLISTAQALINMKSMSLENISLATGLPLEKVEELSKVKN